MALPSGWSIENGSFISKKTVNGVTFTVQTNTNDKRVTLCTVTALVTGTDGKTSDATNSVKSAFHEALVTLISNNIGTGNDKAF